MAECVRCFKYVKLCRRLRNFDVINLQRTIHTSWNIVYWTVNRSLWIVHCESHFLVAFTRGTRLKWVCLWSLHLVPMHVSHALVKGRYNILITEFKNNILKTIFKVWLYSNNDPEIVILSDVISLVIENNFQMYLCTFTTIYKTTSFCSNSVKNVNAFPHISHYFAAALSWNHCTGWLVNLLDSKKYMYIYAYS